MKIYFNFGSYAYVNENNFWFSNSGWKSIYYRRGWEASAKSYFEVRSDSTYNGYNYLILGIGNETTIPTFIEAWNKSASYYFQENTFRVNGSILPALSINSVGSTKRGLPDDTLMFAHDNANGNMWAGRNGYWFGGLPNTKFYFVENLFDAADNANYNSDGVNSTTMSNLTYNTSDGLYNRSFFMNGSNSNFSIYNTLLVFTSNFCLEFWVKPTVMQTSVLVRIASNTFQIIMDAAGVVYAWSSAGTGAHSAPINVNAWHHIVIQRTNTTLDIYVDGVKSAVPFTITTENPSTPLFEFKDLTSSFLNGYVSDIAFHTNPYSANFTPSEYALRAINPASGLAAHAVYTGGTNTPYFATISCYSSYIRGYKILRFGENKYIPPDQFTPLPDIIDSPTKYKPLRSQFSAPYQTNPNGYGLITKPTPNIKNIFLWSLDADSSKKYGSISGYTNVTNIPVQAHVELHTEVPHIHLQTKYSNPDGSYTFYDVPDTECYIIARHPDYNYVIHRQIYPV